MTEAIGTAASATKPSRLAGGGRSTREFALVVLGQAGVAVAGLVGLRLLTTVLAPSEFGRLALRMEVAMSCGTCDTHGCLDCRCGSPASCLQPTVS